MGALPFSIEPFELTKETDFTALHTFNSQIRAEKMPDEPPISLEETIQNWTSFPPFHGVEMWVVHPVDKTEIIASAVTFIFKEETQHNQHLMQFRIDVHPAYRRQGIARQLLSKVVANAKKHNRRLLLTDTDSMIPAGEAAIKKLGGQPGLSQEINRLLVKDVDIELMHTWQMRAQERAAGFQLGIWKGAIPEADLEAYVEIKKVMNTAPFEDLEVEEFQYTGEQMRQEEAAYKARGIERWIMYVRAPENNAIAGYTEVAYQPKQPERLDQADTAVQPDYRQRGLGRWLKAAMIEKVMTERPMVNRIYTGNAHSNAPMLKINHEMGFRLYKANTVWQVDIETAEAYLNKS